MNCPGKQVGCPKVLQQTCIFFVSDKRLIYKAILICQFVGTDIIYTWVHLFCSTSTLNNCVHTMTSCCIYSAFKLHYRLMNILKIIIQRCVINGKRLDTNEWVRFGAEGQWAPPAWLRPKCALFALFGLIADSGPDVNLIPNTGQVLGLLVLSKWLLNVTYALSSFYTFFQKWIIKEPGQIHWYCMPVKPQIHFCLTLLYYLYPNS